MIFVKWRKRQHLGTHTILTWNFLKWIPAPFLCCLHLAKHLCRTSLPNAINFEEQAMAFGRADDDRKVCLSFTEILTGRQMGSHFWTCAAFRGARYWFFNHKATKHPWITSDLCMSLRVQSQSRKWPENSNPVHPLLKTYSGLRQEILTRGNPYLKKQLLKRPDIILNRSYTGHDC